MFQVIGGKIKNVIDECHSTKRNCHKEQLVIAKHNKCDHILFVLMTPQARRIVPYQRPQILLAARMIHARKQCKIEMNNISICLMKIHKG